MGIDYNANLGYGIKLEDEELISKINESEIEIDNKVFKTIWAGDAYAGEMDTFLVIKKSVYSSHSWDEMKDPILPIQLIVEPEWIQLVIDWCRQHNITDYKLGWWLCSSVS